MKEKNTVVELVESHKDRLKRTATVLAIGSAGMSMVGCSSMEAVNYGTPNPDATSITVDNGANLRTEPRVDSVDDTTLLEKVDLRIASSVTINTPHGLYESQNNNGRWFGISAADLPAFDKAKADSDGIIWVNEQMAIENLDTASLKASS